MFAHIFLSTAIMLIIETVNLFIQLLKGALSKTMHD